MGPATANFLSGLDVLLVDDVPDNLELLRRYLTKTGARVSTAINGADAVDLIDSSKVDLILMDIHMPVMDGCSAAIAIREKSFFGKIVAITATDITLLKTLADQGVFDYVLNKPVAKDELLKKLSELLSLKAETP